MGGVSGQTSAGILSALALSSLVAAAACASGHARPDDAGAPLDAGGEGSLATALSVGGFDACVLLPGGSVECWGDNVDGELGTGQTSGPEFCDGFSCATTPVAVSGLSGVAPVIGADHTCAVLSDQTVTCWGQNLPGAPQVLGGVCGLPNPGTIFCSPTPVPVSGLSGVTTMAAGDRYNCALSSGILQCWGKNDSYQLGNRTTTNSTTPVPVAW
jgi:alpha-tubulin suppressor-like RCC1 family protein